ncbi:hypothetical protein NE237_008496 [Protea cynaroides]|uniref:Uncharacterized protein n=1 Tax=Protea cynaroides TaxID=273540 RepID=A0A9Q0KWL2_9MAGN|nr:hypothetical protein NE237_008496 [Protea cynaroides]
MTLMPMSSTSSGISQNPSHVNPLSASTRDSRLPFSPPATSTITSFPASYTNQVLPVAGGKFANPPTQMAFKITQDSSSIHPSQHQGILYPVASSSGRAFIPESFRPQSPDQLVTIANSGGGGFPPRSLMAFPNHVQVRPFGFPPADPPAHAVHVMWPSHLQPFSESGPRQMGAAVPGTIKSLPAVLNPNVAPFLYSSPDFNCYKEFRDRCRDDTVVTIHNRKVRISDGASLYALCRSWAWNGLPQETQPIFGEGVKLLPRPLPVTAADTHLPKKDEADDEEEEKEEGTDSVEHLSPRELLQRHIKRAKRVRARLREERLQCIARYKQRLALLLPPAVEQLRNDGTLGS